MNEKVKLLYLPVVLVSVVGRECCGILRVQGLVLALPPDNLLPQLEHENNDGAYQGLF